ncbi:Fatty acyl-CoA elongase/Polyunsaturated fatty acid specific elongation enzyme [Mucor velutinosus]|uniref:Fatty acyl-CoA elongase/Polyunsaturated fatty acid specific elongation enzyme n=1 Tax=Mucor velutinosus TaxID=708070 RepID=A0AAN7DC89_9FUNG|nr:Fatty acyl-CoA elongase/Polyunsaturated fatty acid specific elongation enzyme [Mucor velutinosus]
MQILSTRGIKVSLTSKRQSKQFLQLLKKDNRNFNSTIHQITVRSKVYYMDFIAILCHCSNLNALDLGGQSLFYIKFYQLLLQAENIRRANDLPYIEEFKFDDSDEVYSLESMSTSSVICADIAAFRSSIKHLHVVLDFINTPGFYRNNSTLKDPDVFIEDILNSQQQKLESVSLAGIGINLTSKRVYRINPVESLQKLEIYLPCMDVQVLRFIEKASPNLEDLSLLSNKSNHFEWMTINGDNSIQTYTNLWKFRDYCNLVATVLVSLSDEFFTVFAHIHQELFEEIDYIWDVFDQDDDEDSFDFNDDSSSYDDDGNDDDDDDDDEEYGLIDLVG